MAGNIHHQSSQTNNSIVDSILNTGQLSRLEHLQLVSTVLSDYKVNDEQRSKINMIFDNLQTGRFKLVD
ncbi:MAG: hypothetical protein F6K31_20815 [Symploca sp. SIO2G7]|nr:hypothetical protein [Symploca sp. SIO2G7]